MKRHLRSIRTDALGASADPRGAYHYMLVDAMRRVMDIGYIKPALERLDPWDFAGDCKAEVEDLIQEAAARDPGAEAPGQALLLDFIDQEIRSLDDFQRHEGFQVERSHSHFHCVDLLADDLDYVFLSVDWWHYALSTEEVDQASGFVFDAERLIHSGAFFRRHDLINGYREVLLAFLRQPHPDVGETLRRGFDKIKREVQVSGEQALTMLRRKGYEGVAEILFPGRLPVEWALQVWENGERIR